MYRRFPRFERQKLSVNFVFINIFFNITYNGVQKCTERIYWFK